VALIGQGSLLVNFSRPDRKSLTIAFEVRGKKNHPLLSTPPLAVLIVSRRIGYGQCKGSCSGMTKKLQDERVVGLTLTAGLG